MPPDKDKLGAEKSLFYQWVKRSYQKTPAYQKYLKDTNTPPNAPAFSDCPHVGFPSAASTLKTPDVGVPLLQPAEARALPLLQETGPRRYP